MFIGISGTVVLLAGIAMIALPGPAFIVIPAGLAILATEFEWAQRLKERLKAKFESTRRHYAEKRRRAKLTAAQRAAR